MKLYYPDSRVTARQHFFSVRVVQLWNKLPEVVVSASSVRAFYIASKLNSCVVFSERELMFMFAICHRRSVCRLSVCRLSVCRLSSLTFVHPTQAIDNFGMFLRHLVPWTSVTFRQKFYGDRPRGTPPSGG